MKYFFVVCWLFMATMTGAQNRTIRFEPLEFRKAAVRARIENKMVFLYAYTTWSEGCRTMAEQVFTQDQVADFCNASFVNIELDMEKGEGRELSEKYGITVFPTFLVVDKDRNEVCRMSGVMNATSFLEKLRTGIDPESSLAALEKRYQEGDRSYACVSEYLDLLHNARLSGQQRALVEDYFKDMEVKEICSENHWKLFDRYVNATDMVSMKRMVAQSAAFKSLLGKERAEKKMYAVYEQALSDLLVNAQDMTATQYKIYGTEIKKMKLGKVQKERLETLMQLAYFKSARMYANYLKTYTEKGKNLTEIQKQNFIYTLLFFAEAPAEMREQAIGLVNRLQECDRKSEKGLSPQLEQVYGYVLNKLNGNPDREAMKEEGSEV